MIPILFFKYFTVLNGTFLRLLSFVFTISKSRSTYMQIYRVEIHANSVEHALAVTSGPPGSGGSPDSRTSDPGLAYILTDNIKVGNITFNKTVSYSS